MGGKHWTKKEEDLLIMFYNACNTYNEISNILDRSFSSVKSKSRKLRKEMSDVFISEDIHFSNVMKRISTENAENHSNKMKQYYIDNPEQKERISKHVKSRWKNGDYDHLDWCGKNNPNYGNIKKKIVKCDYCRNEIWRHDYRLNAYKHFFCNKKCYGKWMCGENNPMYGKSPKYPRNKWWKKGKAELGHGVRSSWEFDFTNILQELEIEYQYEPKRFELVLDNGKKVTYVPDFYIPLYDTWFELKGVIRKKDKQKIKKFKVVHPNFELVDEQKYYFLLDDLK